MWVFGLLLRRGIKLRCFKSVLFRWLFSLQLLVTEVKEGVTPVDEGHLGLGYILFQ